MKAVVLVAIALWPLGALWAQTDARKADGFAPLAYFDENCARCHGPNGSFYGAEFGKTLETDADLKRIVREMCEGPGGAPLDAAKLEILTDFHRALRDDRPFLVVVSQSAMELKGEASPDAIVKLENGEKCVTAERKGNTWSLNWPVDFARKNTKLVARRGEKSVEVIVGE